MILNGYSFFSLLNSCLLLTKFYSTIEYCVAERRITFEQQTPNAYTVLLLSTLSTESAECLIYYYYAFDAIFGDFLFSFLDRNPISRNVRSLITRHFQILKRFNDPDSVSDNIFIFFSFFQNMNNNKLTECWTLNAHHIWFCMRAYWLNPLWILQIQLHSMRERERIECVKWANSNIIYVYSIFEILCRWINVYLNHWRWMVNGLLFNGFHFQKPIILTFTGISFVFNSRAKCKVWRVSISLSLYFHPFIPFKSFPIHQLLSTAYGKWI